MTDDVVPHTLTVRRVVAGTPERLYAAWTEPDQMRRWYATVVDADVRVGGAYRIELHEDDGSVNGFTGEYLRLEPPALVEFTFRHHGLTPEDRISGETVTVEFRAAGAGRTEVVLTNRWTGPPCEPSDYTSLAQGWEQWFDMLEKSDVLAV
ncbi:hypothetical protein BJF78_15495 [Pseudonocardia sp. CNS-139]|nr:hypothetical protein BJF78_15495 [Pseudonocardia sp. CNS-139]